MVMRLGLRSKVVLKDIEMMILIWLANLRNHYSSHRLKLKDKSLLKAALKDPENTRIIIKLILKIFKIWERWNIWKIWKKIWEIRTYEISGSGHRELRSNYILDKWLVRWGKFSICFWLVCITLHKASITPFLRRTLY